MATLRKITHILEGKKTSDGAGVSLMRIFGYYESNLFDPFLMLDFFGSDNPDEYMAGFPWHPHRGIETVTYMLAGSVEHGDSLGNSGVIHAGDIQWMTAGSGIIHQEMPKAGHGGMRGFQLWVNLPAAHKMMEPRYQEIRAAEIPVVEVNGATIRIIAGELNGIKGPVKDIIADPLYFDISMEPGSEFSLDVNPGYTVFAFVFDGEASFDEVREKPVMKNQLVSLTDGDRIRVSTKTNPVKFILVSGKPLNEPVAWRGPIVMNTEAELDVAFREFRNGTFIKK